MRKCRKFGDCLIEDWKRVLNNATSVKAAVLAVFFQILSFTPTLAIIAEMLPQVADVIPEHPFRILSMIFTILIPVLRITKQANDDANANDPK